MATSQRISYLTRPLSSPVDPSLQSKQEHHDMQELWTRPPGISTLEEWGQLKAQSGKQQGRTFEDIYQNERSYTKQLWNRKAVTSWIRSFQLFCRHRREASVENQQREAQEQGLQMPINPHMMPEVKDLILKGGAPWWSPRTNARAIQAKAKAMGSDSKSSSQTDQEWHHVEIEEKGHKRGLSNEKNNTMETQPNADRVNQLQAQIAVLQRDLHREMQGMNVPPEDC
eukprot:s617_g36.t1